MVKTFVTLLSMIAAFAAPGAAQQRQSINVRGHWVLEVLNADRATVTYTFVAAPHPPSQ